MLRDIPKIEARPFGPGSTPAEIAAIKQRIYQLEPGIYIWHEIPIQSIFTVQLHADTLNELTAGLESFKYVVDLRDAQPPSQEVRAHIIRVCNEDMPRCKAIAVWTGRNFLANVFSKFIIAAFMGLKKHCTLHKTLEDAVHALRKG